MTAQTEPTGRSGLGTACRSLGWLLILAGILVGVNGARRRQRTFAFIGAVGTAKGALLVWVGRRFFGEQR